MTYLSFAKWPKEISLGTVENVSRDTHRSWREADNICSILEEKGFGGEGRIFPLKTWVEEKKW